MPRKRFGWPVLPALDKTFNSSAKIALFELEPFNFDRSRSNKAVFEREADCPSPGSLCFPMPNLAGGFPVIIPYFKIQIILNPVILVEHFLLLIIPGDQMGDCNNTSRLARSIDSHSPCVMTTFDTFPFGRISKSTMTLPIASGWSSGHCK